MGGLDRREEIVHFLSKRVEQHQPAQIAKTLWQDEESSESEQVQTDGPQKSVAANSIDFWDMHMNLRIIT